MALVVSASLTGSSLVTADSTVATISSPPAVRRDEEKGGSPALKKAADGTLLVPQPTDDPDEPLNWTPAKKLAALLVLAFGTFFVNFTATVLAPGALALSKQFGVSPAQSTYVASAASIVPGIAPFVWIPLSRKLGRRPVLTAGTALAIVFGILVATAETFARALACRIAMAFGASSAICIAPAAISDMFFVHEKGRRMGLGTFFLVSAPYLGGVAGGSIMENPSLGWRWTMYLSSILLGALLICQYLFGMLTTPVSLVQVPETIFDRSRAVNQRPVLAEGDKAIGPNSRHGQGFCDLRFREPTATAGDSWGYTFTRPFAMFVYPAVVLPSAWFSIAAMTEVANTAGFALNFGADSRWRFTTLQVGFCSFAGLIGAMVGEMLAGPQCDRVARRHLARKSRSRDWTQHQNQKPWQPEKLLPLTIPGLVAVSAGLLLYGLELTYPTSWPVALLGIILFTAGQEIIMTVLITYMTDCYPDCAAEISVVFQFFLNAMAYPPPFYTPTWVKQPGGPKVAYIVFAMLPVVTFPLGVGLLIWKGAKIRARGPWFVI